MNESTGETPGSAALQAATGSAEVQTTTDPAAPVRTAAVGAAETTGTAWPQSTGLLAAEF